MKAFGEHQARKRFGQNFLVDQNIINHIVRAIHPRTDDNLVEIGPGQGAITEPLLEACEQLQVVELDRDLIPRLESKFRDFPGLRIHQGDALKFDFSQLAGEKPLRIVGNLPYNISTPLIFHLLQYHGLIGDMHFMLQKEVVARMASEPSKKDYGRLSIMSQYHCKVEHLFDVGPHCFHPAPKVDSAIVRLTPHSVLPYPATNPELLDKLVRTAFQQRRKTLRNALKSVLQDDFSLLDQVAIDANQRPENLSVQDFVRLANLIQSQAA